MFKNSVQYYDSINNFKDYKKASKDIKNYILKFNSKYKTILNVACRTGNHD